MLDNKTDSQSISILSANGSPLAVDVNHVRASLSVSGDGPVITLPMDNGKVRLIVAYMHWLLVLSFKSVLFISCCFITYPI